MTRRTLFNILKYFLAFGLLSAVVYLSWGYPEKVAGTVRLGSDPTEGTGDNSLTVAGTVAAFTPDSSITIETAAGQGQPARQVHFLLIRDRSIWEKIKEGSSPLEKHTRFEPEDEPIRPGMAVSVTETPPGLAYVWQRHVVKGEPIHLNYLALAFLSLTAAFLLTVIRWYVLVRAQELPFTVTNAMRLGMVGLFFSAFLPGSVGGDIIKAAFLAREQNRRTVAVATVIIDRALALWALIWFVALIGIGFWATGMLGGKAERVLQLIVIGAAAIVAISLLIWVLMGLLSPDRAERFAARLSRVRRVGHSLAEFWRAIWMYRCKQRSVALAMLIALVGHVGFVLTFYFCALVLRDPGQEIPSWRAHFLIVPIGMVIQAVPLFPGGAGIGEAGYGGLYALVGCAAAMGVLASLVQRVCTWVLGLIGYLVYLRLKSSVQPPAEKPAELAAVEA